jgi:hypothetical protein
VAEPEACRNRLLRRVDWRVLLPDPNPGKTLCCAGGLLAEAIARVSGSVVRPGDANDGQCDLAVASDPDRRTLATCAAAVRPGGHCYVESTRRRPGGLRRTRRRLRAAGFDPVAAYWPWPNPDTGAPEVWVPLDAPAARAHFLASRPRPAGRVARAAHVSLRGAWSVGRRLGLVAPVGVIARRAGASNGDDLARRALRAASPAHVGPASLLLVTGGPRSVSKIVAFAFAEPDRSPRFAVKLSRTSEAAALLRREADVLRMLHARRQPAGVPRVAFVEDHGDVVAVAETVMPGTSLARLVTPATYAALARRAADWAADLAGPGGAATERGEYVAPVIERFDEQFGAVVDAGVRRAAGEAIGSLPLLPTVWEHRDFAAWNVLVAPDGALSVLDWEGAIPDGLPGFDLLYFLAHQAFYLEDAWRSGRYREAHRGSLDERTLAGSVAAEALRGYGARIDLPDGAWPGLRVLHWMLKADSEHRRFMEDAAGGRPPVATLRTSIFLALWEEEVRALGG